MKQGIIRFKLVDNPSAKKPEFYNVESSLKHTGLSPQERQTLFLKTLHSDGFEPFDMDDAGFQYWRRRGAV